MAKVVIRIEAGTRLVIETTKDGCEHKTSVYFNAPDWAIVDKAIDLAEVLDAKRTGLNEWETK